MVVGSRRQRCSALIVWLAPQHCRIPMLFAPIAAWVYVVDGLGGIRWSGSIRCVSRRIGSESLGLLTFVVARTTLIGNRTLGRLANTLFW